MGDKQETKMAYCPICKKQTIFIQDANKHTIWVCTNSTCIGYRTDKLRKSPMLVERGRGLLSDIKFTDKE